MKQKDFSSESVRKKLSGEGLRPKKSLGQNFLTDASVLAEIVGAQELTDDSCVLEIGPGMGVLTRELAKRAGKVVAVEIDTSILPVLEENLAEFDHVKVINRDILKVDLNELFREEFGEGKQVHVVANLPYYITTPIVMKLLEHTEGIDSIVIMIQREVARRLAAREGTKDFGAISLSVQYRARVTPICDVPPEAFHPAPKVWSSVVRLDLLEKPAVSVLDEAHFLKLIRAGFLQRRKTFLNSVSADSSLSISKEAMKEALLSLGYPETVRGEALGLSDYARISDYFVQKKIKKQVIFV